MADDNMKIGVELDVKTNGLKSLNDLEREILGTASKIAGNDKETLKRLKGLTNAHATLTQAMKIQSTTADKAAKAEQRRIQTAIEWSTEQRKAAKEGRLADEAVEKRANRAAASAKRRASEAASAARKQVRDVQMVSRMRESYEAGEIKSLANRRKEQVKNFLYGQKLRENTERQESDSHKRQVRNVNYLEGLKRRSMALEERAANADKRISDTRQRHMINQQNTLRGLNQFMNRHIGLLAYRGSIEEEYASKAMKGLRSQMAGSLLKYRADQKAARQKGTYDAAEEQRIQNRFQTEVKSARRAFNTTMSFGRAEQQADNRRAANKMKLEREYHRERERAKGDMYRGASQANNHMGRAMGSISSPAHYVMAAVTGGVIAKAIQQGISTRMSVDTAETNLRIFGSEPAGRKGAGSTMTQDDVKKVRSGWLDKAGVQNGMSPAQGLNTYTEVLKAGIEGPKAREFTELLLEANAAMDLPIDEVTKVMGKIAQNVPGVGKDRMKNILNSMAIAAGTTASDPSQIVAGMKRGMGVFAQSNMTPEQLAAYTAVGSGAGIQEGKTGNFISELVSSIGRAGKERGQRGKDLNFAARELGFGSAKNLSRAGQEDMSGTIETLLTNFKNLDASKKSIVAVRLSMREWDDETLQFVNSIDKLKDTLAAISDPRNANYLDKGKTEKMGSWGGMWNTTKATFGLFWDAFGNGFTGILTEISVYFKTLGSNFNFSQISKFVSESIEGLKHGLGFKTWRDALEGVFGSGTGQLDSVARLRDFRKFFNGLGEGISSVVGMIGKAFSMFLGKDAGDLKAMGKLTGQIISLSFALLALAPVLSIFGGIVSIILGIAAAARGIASAVRFASMGAGTGVGVGVGAAAGAGATMLRGAGMLLSRMFTLGLVAEIGANRGTIVTWMIEAVKPLLTSMMEGLKYAFSIQGLKDLFSGVADEFVPTPIKKMLESSPELKAGPSNALGGAGNGIRPSTPSGPSTLGKVWDWITGSIIGTAHASPDIPRPGMDSPQTRVLENTNRSLEKLNETMEDSARFHRQSYQEMGGGSGGIGGLIHRAAILSGSTAMGGFGSSSSSTPYSGGGIRGSFGGGGGYQMVSGPLGNSIPGSALNGGSGLSSRGIIGGGGGGGGAASGPIRDRMKSVYDAYRSAGLSHESAKSFAAEIGRENDFNPKLMFGSHIDPHNGKRNAGMMSWQGDRATKLLETLRAGGHLNSDGSIKQTQESLNAQAKFSLDEMKNGALGPKGQRALGVLQNPNASHADRALALGDDVIKWRQHDPRYASHALKRDRYYNQMEGVSSSGAGGIGGSATSSQVLSSMQTLQQSGRVMNEQCVSLAKAAVGATGSVTSWQKGEGADAGTLKPGTPVATFLDRMGRQTAKYAGGGTGTPGANLDHAGVFQEYIKDAAGKNIGMRIAEQYKGSGGVHSKDYMFGKGFGEKNASNYSAILGPDGKYLGGANNPMNQIAKQADDIKSSGWKKGGQSGATPNAFGGSASAMTMDAPMRQQNVQPTIEPKKLGQGAGGGGGGGGATIHVNGSNMDPESVANAVQRKINNDAGRRTNDVDFSYA